MSIEDAAVDVVECGAGREGHVEHAEQRDEPRVHFIPSTACLTHSSQEGQVLHVLPIEIFTSIIAAVSLQQLLEHSYRLLSAVSINLSTWTC